MITVNLMGGTGNQLFQYAMGRALAARGKDVIFSTHELDRDPARMYLLDQMGLNLRLTKDRGPKPWYGEGSMRYNPAHLEIDNVTMHGYWQTEKYFLPVREEILKEVWNPDYGFYISPKTEEFRNQITSSPNSAFLHVRRSDALSARAVPYHGVVGLDYYNAAANLIRDTYTDAHFFIFSDDIPWARENFKADDVTIVDSNPPSFIVLPDNELEKVPGGREVEDLYLMSLCRHGITSNSTFSWWGAWLHETGLKRTVIAPQQWFVTKDLDSTDLVPEAWIRL